MAIKGVESIAGIYQQNRFCVVTCECLPCGMDSGFSSSYLAGTELEGSGGVLNISSGYEKNCLGHAVSHNPIGRTPGFLFNAINLQARNGERPLGST